MARLDSEHFCSARLFDWEEGRSNHLCCTGDCDSGCVCLLSRWPTPDRFEYEYGRKPENLPFYYFDQGRWNLRGDWYNEDYGAFYKGRCVIACTPYGKPDDDWRPE